MLELAKTMVRQLQPKAGSRIVLALTNQALESALLSLLEASGVDVVEDSGAHGCLIQVDGIQRTLAPASRQAIEQVSTGGKVVAVALGGTRGVVEGIPECWAPRLRSSEVEAQPFQSMTIISGVRNSPMSNQERKRLRALGHGLEASVLIGRAGLSPELIEATETALMRHGIVKVKLTSSSDLDKASALNDLAWGTGAFVIQRVGKSAVLYRSDVKLDPPSKRSGRR